MHDADVKRNYRHPHSVTTGIRIEVSSWQKDLETYLKQSKIGFSTLAAVFITRYCHVRVLAGRLLQLAGWINCL